jgi:pimeloyl-ACP methyl ester carboxylesterase/DNA-binding SARP family transcriptional activator
MRPPSVPHRLDLRLHGYPTFAIDGGDVALKLKRGLALLALLSERGAKLSRAQAAALLWPDAAEDVGRSRLRRLVPEVHAACGAEPVAADGDALWLDPSWDVASDVQRVRAAAHALLGAGNAQPPDAACVVEAGAAAFLDGFEIDSDTFGDWLAQHRAEHRRLLARALLRLAEQASIRGDGALAVEAAERLIALDPAVDAGYAALIAAQAARRDLAAVESAYFRCADFMRAEFGAAPSPAVESAYSAARARVEGAGDAGATDWTTAATSAVRIRFAQTSDGAVAYSVHGDSGPTLVVVPGLLSHIEIALEEPRIRRCVERLAERHRVVLVDRRGTGLSERVGVAPTIDSAVEDVAAVVDALDAPDAWLFGASIGGAIAIAAAATMRERLAGLVLYGAGARGSRAPDYPWAMTGVQLQLWLGLLRGGWGGATSLEAFAPSAANDPQVQAWWARMLRSAASQNGLAAILRGFHETDVRDRLPALRMPVLVIQREDDRIVRQGAARYLASQVPQAELVMLPGADHWWWHGDADAVIRAIDEFVARKSA